MYYKKRPSSSYGKSKSSYGKSSSYSKSKTNNAKSKSKSPYARKSQSKSKSNRYQKPFAVKKSPSSAYGRTRSILKKTPTRTYTGRAAGASTGRAAQIHALRQMKDMGKKVGALIKKKGTQLALEAIFKTVAK